MYTLDTIRKVSVPARAVELRSALKESISSRIGMLLGADEVLPIMGGSKFKNVVPNEHVVACYLIPRYCAAIHSLVGFSERAVAAEMERLLIFHRCQVESENNREVSEIEPDDFNTSQSLQSWVLNISKDMSNRERATSTQANFVRWQLSKYIADVCDKCYAKEESLQFWTESSAARRYPKLLELAKLMLCVPASSIPQERHFSELKRRCAGLRTRTKIDTLDRDAVVFAWYKDPN